MSKDPDDKAKKKPPVPEAKKAPAKKEPEEDLDEVEAEGEDDDDDGDGPDSDRDASDEAEDEDGDEADSEPPKKPEPRAKLRPEGRDGPTQGGGNPLLLAAITLVAGGVVGWLARGAPSTPEVTAKPDASAVVATTGSASPDSGEGAPKACQDWAQTLCEGAGPTSEGCAQAKAAAGLLSGSACEKAAQDAPAAIAKLKSARSSCDQLVTKLCDALGKDSQTCKMVTEKTPSFPTKQCTEMMANFDDVLAELKRIEAQNAPLTAEVAAAQRAGDGPGFGPLDAKVAVVEYSDFECPYCSKAAEAVHALKEKYGDKVRFVFRQYPLPMHKNAQVAAEASLAAHAQGKFFEMHDLMFKNQRALDRESLEKYAKEIGLDMAKFKKALDDHTYAPEVEADKKLGETLGVSGTPTMIVGTERVQNPTDAGVIGAMIDKATAKGE